jgi:tetratricopeptide (TPR) repeat protein
VYSAQLSLEAGHSEEALKKIDSALRLNPKDVDGLILKAQALNASGHTDEALDWISHSLAKVANSLPLLLARSEIIQRKEGQKAYLKSLQEIAQDYPKDPKVLQMYGQALAENGQPADALHITQLALKADPDQLDMHLLAGRLLRSTGQLDQAIDHFAACVQIDPEHVDSYLEMAKTYQERRDYPKAGTLFEKVIEIAPRDYRGYYQLGLLLRDSKDYRGAEAMLRKASELTKEDVNILRQLGAIIALNLVHNPQEASIHS